MDFALIATTRHVASSSRLKAVIASEAWQSMTPRLPRRFAPRNDSSDVAIIAMTPDLRIPEQRDQ
jgi:hypothetical protein